MYKHSNQKLKLLWIVIIISVGGVFLWQNQKEDFGELIMKAEEMERFSPENKNQASKSQRIGVHIAGAVCHPGVYFLSPEARVIDLITAAGGVLKKADLNQINLAETLIDGQKVFIPLQQISIANNQITSSSKNSQVSSEKISINRGSKADLMNLPGIGPSKAEAIIEYRKENGFFRKLAELTEVSGIGEKTYQHLKGLITLF